MKVQILILLQILYLSFVNCAACQCRTSRSYKVYCDQTKSNEKNTGFQVQLFILNNGTPRPFTSDHMTTPDWTGYTEHINFKDKDAFKTIKSDWPNNYYAVLWTAKIQIYEGGSYTFKTVQDDYALIMINGQIVVQNGEGDVTLLPGWHDFSATFYEYSGGEKIILTFKGPDTDNEEKYLSDKENEGYAGTADKPNSCVNCVGSTTNIIQGLNSDDNFYYQDQGIDFYSDFNGFSNIYSHDASDSTIISLPVKDSIIKVKKSWICPITECWIVSSYSSNVPTPHGYDATSFVQMETSNKIDIQFTRQRPFYLKLKFQCRNYFDNYNAFHSGEFELKVDCISSSSDLNKPTNFITYQNQSIDGTKLKFKFSQFQNTEPNCVIAYIVTNDLDYWETPIQTATDFKGYGTSAELYGQTRADRVYYKGNFTIQITATPLGGSPFIAYGQLDAYCDVASFLLKEPLNQDLTQQIESGTSGNYVLNFIGNQYGPCGKVCGVKSAEITTFSSLSTTAYSDNQELLWMGQQSSCDSTSQIKIKSNLINILAEYKFKILVLDEGGKKSYYNQILTLRSTCDNVGVQYQQLDNYNTNIQQYRTQNSSSQYIDLPDFKFISSSGQKAAWCQFNDMKIAYQQSPGGLFSTFSENILIETKIIKIVKQQGSKRIIQISTHDDKIESIIYPTIRVRLQALGLDQQSIFKGNYTNTDYVKYYDFNFTVTCGKEGFIDESPESIEIVYELKIYNKSDYSSSFSQSFNTSECCEPLNANLVSQLESPLQNIFMTNQSQCPTTSYSIIQKTNLVRVVEPLRPLTIQEMKTWSPSLIIQKQPMNQRITLKAMTEGNITKSQDFNIIVCGLEEIYSLIDNQLYFTFNHTSNNAPNFITKKEYDFWFQFEKENGSDDCQDPQLYLLKNDLSPFKDETLATIDDDQNIVIYSGTKTKALSIMVRRCNKSLIKCADVQIIIEICGLETVILVQDKLLQFTFYQYQGQGNSKGMLQIPKQIYSVNFASTSQRCKPWNFQVFSVYQKSQDYLAKFQADQTQIQVSGNKDLIIKTDLLGKTDFLIGPIGQQNVVYLNATLDIIENIYTGLGPRFDQDLQPVTVELDDKVAKMLNEKKRSDFDQKFFISLPPINDNDQAKLTKITIIDDEINGKNKSFGSITTFIDGQTFQLSQNKIMKYDQSKNQIVLQFDSSQQLINVNGTHYLTITLYTDQKAQKSQILKVVMKIPSLQQERNKNQLDEGIQKKVTATIKSFSSSGQMIIIFDHQMNTDFDLNYINTTSLQMYISPSQDYFQSEQDFNISQFNFTWECTSYEKQTMTLNIDFQSYIWISQQNSNDEIVVYFKNQNLFLSEEGYALKTVRLSKNIPKQMENSKFTADYQNSASQAKSFFMYALGFQILLNLVATGGLSYMISFINSMQIILNLPILRPLFPSNTLVACRLILGFVSFDILEDNEQYQKIVSPESSFGEEIYLREQDQFLGYDSYNPMVNLGWLQVVIALYVLLYLLYFMVVWPASVAISFTHTKSGLCFRANKTLTKLLQKMRQLLFYKDPLIIMLEGYIELSLAGIFASMVPESSKDNTLVLQILRFVYQYTTKFGFPLFLIWFLFQKMDTIRSQSFQSKYGPLVHDVKLKNKSESVFYVIFIVRRLIFISLTQVETQVYQIIIMNFCNLAMLIYQGQFNPLCSRLKNRIEKINELIIMVCTFYLMIYTDWVSLPQTQFNYGWTNVIVIFISSLVNILVVIWFSCRDITLILTKYYLIIKAKKEAYDQKNELIQIQKDKEDMRKFTQSKQEWVKQSDNHWIQNPDEIQLTKGVWTLNENKESSLIKTQTLRKYGQTKRKKIQRKKLHTIQEEGSICEQTSSSIEKEENQSSFEENKLAEINSDVHVTSRIALVNSQQDNENDENIDHSQIINNNNNDLKFKSHFIGETNQSLIEQELQKLSDVEQNENTQILRRDEQNWNDQLFAKSQPEEEIKIQEQDMQSYLNLFGINQQTND